MSVDDVVFSSKRCEWETPRHIFDALDDFWKFTLDPASSDENALCDKHYTKEDDGLSHSWRGERVFLNPPYGSEIGDWVRKAYNECLDGTTVVIALLPARTDVRWFHDYILGKADEVKFIKGRLSFCIDGIRCGQAPFPSMLVRWGGRL